MGHVVGADYAERCTVSSQGGKISNDLPIPTNFGASQKGFYLFQ